MLRTRAASCPPADLDLPTPPDDARSGARRKPIGTILAVMGSVALGARLLLALVFAAAAVGKLADQSGTRASLRDFRVPAKTLWTLALALPLTELAVAAALAAQPTARLGAAATLALLSLFASGIVLAMVRGETPDCHCFGQLHSQPAGRRTLARNASLAVPAVFVLTYGPGRSLDKWLPARSSAEVVALVALCLLVALGVASVELYRRNRRMARHLARTKETMAAFPVGLPIGARAPRFSVKDLDGRTVTLDGLLAERKPVSLVFANPDCGPCAAMFPTLARWQRHLADRMTIVIAASASAPQLRPLADVHGLRNVLIDRDAEMFESYHASGTPSAVIVTADGKIGSPTRSTTVIVEALIRRALEQRGEDLLRPGRAASDGSIKVLRSQGTTAPR